MNRFLRYSLTSMLLLLTTVVVFSQSIEFNKTNFPNDKKGLRKAIKDINEGDKNYELGRVMYLKALDHYLAAQAFNPRNAVLNYKIGKCYLNTVQKDKSIEYLERALELSPSVSLDAGFLLAYGYHLTLDFDKAIENYTKFKNSLSPADLETYGRIVDRRIQQCNVGKELVQNPERVFIDNLGSVVNSQYPDYSPMISADESVIMFTSRSEGSTGNKRDPLDLQFFEDIHISYKIDGRWTAARNPGKPLNTSGHDATAGLSPDGQTLFIYKGTKGGDIYECVQRGNNWSKPKKMPKPITSKFHESSASLSPDGRTIYFISQRPGGYGGRDIYKSTKNEKGKWGPVSNVGPIINTEFDEESVFMHPDGKTMYFSSQGHRTMGGYDIFKSVFENEAWSEPQNLGYPINTPDDDVFFTMSASGARGYYSSERIGGLGGQDIYVITFLGAEKPVVFHTEDDLLAILSQPVSGAVIESAVEIQTSQLTLLKGFIRDSETQTPLHAKIELIDNELNQQIAVFESNSATGRYLVSLPSGKNYGLTVSADGYLFHSENFNISSSRGYQEIEKDIMLKKIEVGTSIVLNNIFFDFNSANLRNESTAELDRLTQLLKDMPKLKIEISGHTDNVGSASYNQRLSENRAKAVVDYLIRKGINTDRLEFKGYGFEQPIATNDNEEGRQMNRRTEFKIVSK
ncbi:MAG: OmpA family protein [Bacteroidales bacterium]|nr:OmpA family protein [Bacteroidales bacterium]